MKLIKNWIVLFISAVILTAGIIVSSCSSGSNPEPGVPEKPEISGVTRDPSSVMEGDAVTVTATVTIAAPETISSVTLKYTVNDGAEQAVNMTGGGVNNSYSGTIPAQTNEAAVAYYVIATGSNGESETSSTYNYTVGQLIADPSKVKLNEVSGAGTDDEKFYELIYTGDVAISLEGWTIEYNANGSTGGAFPPTDPRITWTGLEDHIIQPGELLLLQGRNEPGSFTTGLTSGRILIITLRDANDNIIDQCIRAQDQGEYAITEQSFSRIPDATGPFYFTATTTPDEMNGSDATGLKLVPTTPAEPEPAKPVITSVTRDKPSVTPSDTVSVTATVTISEGTIASVKLIYKVDSGNDIEVTMTAGANNKYSGVIPSQSDDALVSYWVVATGDNDEITTSTAQQYTVSTETWPTATGGLMILQANTYGNTSNGGFPSSAVELYNDSDSSITLDGVYYLHIGNATEWTNVIPLTGTIPAKTSYLITGNGNVAIGPLPTADLTADFEIANDNFAIAILKNQTTTLTGNLFDNESIRDKYVDLLGVGETVFAFETLSFYGDRSNSATRQARPRIPRRTSLTDTNDNSVDFAVYVFSGGTTSADLDIVWPRNVAAGKWNPMTGVSIP